MTDHGRKTMRASEPSDGVERQDLREVPNDEAAGNGKPEWWTSDHWSTPQSVFDAIAAQYGPFDLDPCATDETKKCGFWYTEEDDGLSQPWRGRVWVNPPYSDPGPWIRKAITSVQDGAAQRVVMLLPASTDTEWFHELVLPHSDVVYVRGRIRFIGWQGTPIGSPKAGSIIAVFPKARGAFSLRTPRGSRRTPRA